MAFLQHPPGDPLQDGFLAGNTFPAGQQAGRGKKEGNFRAERREPVLHGAHELFPLIFAHEIELCQHDDRPRRGAQQDAFLQKAKLRLPQGGDGRRRQNDAVAHGERPLRLGKSCRTGCVAAGCVEQKRADFGEPRTHA